MSKDDAGPCTIGAAHSAVLPNCNDANRRTLLHSVLQTATIITVQQYDSRIPLLLYRPRGCARVFLARSTRQHKPYPPASTPFLVGGLHYCYGVLIVDSVEAVTLSDRWLDEDQEQTIYGVPVKLNNTVTRATEELFPID